MSSDQSLQIQNLLDPADGHSVAVRLGGETRTWQELESNARRLAQAVRSEGLEIGQSWAVLSHNCVEWTEWILGNARAGTRLVPLNWHLTATELAALLTDSAARILLVGPGLEAVGAKAAELAGGVRIITMTGHYREWLSSHSDDLLPECQAGSVMFFTGGTTGRSKGVLRSDMKLTASRFRTMWAGWGDLVRMPDSGTTLVTTPLYHAMGLATLGASLCRGVTTVLLERFTPHDTLQAIQQHQITATAMVPTQFVRLLKLDSDDRSQYDVSSLEWVLHTAAPCPEWAKRAMIEWFGPVIYEMYGSSEGTGPAICDSHEWLKYPGTVGKASARISYSIVDDDGHDLGPGEVGTIYCERDDGGPEYFGSPEKTAASRLPDGRFTVGDLGWLNEQGYLFLADRRVDLIITGGANVYPAELEAALIEYPGIADIAVFGVPDPEWGQKIVAVIESAPSVELDLDDVRSFARQRLAAYKVPRVFELTDSLPREAHGKLKKHLLRDSYTT